MNFKQIKKNIRLSIKNHDINHFIQISKQNNIFIYKNYHDWYFTYCINQNEPQIFKLLLEHKPYLTYYDILNIFQFNCKEPFTTLTIEHLEKHPETKYIQKIYSLILVYTIKHNYRDKNKINYLVNLKQFNFENNIKNPVYLYTFISSFFPLYRLRKKTLNNIIDFFTPYINQNIIDKELCISFILLNYAGPKTPYLNKQNKEFLKNIDKHKKIKFCIFPKHIYTFYFAIYCDHELEIEKCTDNDCKNHYTNDIKSYNDVNLKNIYDKSLEIEMGAFIKLIPIDVKDIIGESVEHFIEEQDKQKINKYIKKLNLSRKITK